MEEDDFSILKKSIIPNLLEDNFDVSHVSTLKKEKLTEEDICEEQDEQTTAVERRKLYGENVDFKRTLIKEEEIFENEGNHKKDDSKHLMIVQDKPSSTYTFFLDFTKD